MNVIEPVGEVLESGLAHVPTLLRSLVVPIVHRLDLTRRRSFVT